MKTFKNNSKYHTSEHLTYSCKYHVIFCPKYRRKVLVDGIDERLKVILVETANRHGFEITDLEVMPDHVHLLLTIEEYIKPVRADKPRISVMIGSTKAMITQEIGRQIWQADLSRLR